MSSCVCLRDDKHKRIVDKGLKRAYNEIEVVRFIKQQRVMKIVLRTLFTDMERFLIRNQH